MSKRILRERNHRELDYSGDSEQESGGLYDRKGFFFKQRRGNLNLRRLETIDIERLIREVDVDILQQNVEDLTFCHFSEQDVQFFSDRQVVKLFRLAQLTIEYLLYSQDKLVSSLSDLSKKYSSKKRTLYEKRKELSSLKEETNSLHSQLKAKRRNVSTLEKLVREANDWKESRLKHEKPPSKSFFVTFFVTFPDGIFVKLEESRDTAIRQLVVLIRNALLLENSPNFQTIKDNKMRLFLRGNLLTMDSTLDQCGVVDGDTILVILPPEVKEEQRPIPENPIKIEQAAPSQPFPSVVIRQEAPDIGLINDAVRKQVELMEKLNSEVSKRISEEIRDSMQRYRSSEDNIALQPANQSNIMLGDLEPDYVEEMKNDLLEKLSNIGDKVKTNSSTLTELKEQMELLKKLADRPVPEPKIITIQAPAPVAAVAPEQVKKPKPERRWNYLPEQGEAPAPIEKKGEVTVVVTEMFQPTLKAAEEPPKVVEKPKPKEFIQAETIVVETPKPATPPPTLEEPRAPTPQPEIPTVAEELIDMPVLKVVSPAASAPPRVQEVVTKTIKVEFPVEYFKDQLPLQNKSIIVGLESDFSTEDTIFTLRTVIASQVRLPFKCVSLWLDGKDIKIEPDVERNVDFRAESIAHLTQIGKLRIKVEKTISNAQIDLLIPMHEKELIEKEKGSEGESKSKSGTGSNGKRFKKKRDFDADEAEELLKDLEKPVNLKVRNSLDKLLRDIGGRASLSDEEYRKFKSELDAASGSESDTLRPYKVNLANTMGALVAESGSESASEDVLRRSRQSIESWGDFNGTVDLMQLRSRGDLSRASPASSLNQSSDLTRRSTVRRSYVEEDWDSDTPMISSLNGPLRFAEQKESRFLASEGKNNFEFSEKKSSNQIPPRREAEETNFSYISSIASREFSDTADSKRQAADISKFRSSNTSEFSPMVPGRLSTSSTGVKSHQTPNSTMNSDVFDLSTTIDSDYLKTSEFSKISTGEIRRRADSYEQRNLSSMGETGDFSITEFSALDEVQPTKGSNESPFKDYHPQSVLSVQEDDVASVHSLALSDSH